MKIAPPKVRDPRSLSLADVAKVPVSPSPGGPRSVPVPYPTGFDAPRGAERRFSVQFMNGLPNKLKLAGLGDELAGQVKHRLSTLDRSGIDREGRVVEALLSGAHPKEAMQAWDQLSKLGALVTPGGFRAEANAVGSWTVKPPDGDPFELKPGQTKALGDGTTLRANEHLLEASGITKATLSAGLRELSRLVDPATIAVALSDAFQGGKRSASDQGRVEQGQQHLQQLNRGLEGLKASDRSADTRVGRGEVFARSLEVLGQAAPEVQKALLGLLEQAGHSPAPSRRSDPAAEKAVLLEKFSEHADLLLQNGAQRAQESVSTLSGLSKRLNGAAREIVLSLR